MSSLNPFAKKKEETSSSEPNKISETKQEDKSKGAEEKKAN